MEYRRPGDNGIAGVAIGGNVGPTLIEQLTYMTSPVINISTAVAPGNVYLEFWRVLNSDYQTFSDSTLEVWNGSAWVLIFNMPGTTTPPHLSESNWKKVTYDVTAYKNANFRIRFGYAVFNSQAWTVGSWNIDDLRLVPQSCP